MGPCEPSGGGRFVERLHDDVERRVPLEREAPRQELVEDDPDGIDVAPRVARLARAPAQATCTRACPSTSPASSASGRRSPPPPASPRSSSATFAIPKSHTFTESVGVPSSAFFAEQHDVLGLQVAVEDPRVVRLRERRERLREDVDDPLVRERPLLVDRGERDRARPGTPSRCRAGRPAPARSRARGSGSGGRGARPPSPRGGSGRRRSGRPRSRGASP